MDLENKKPYFSIPWPYENAHITYTLNLGFRKPKTTLFNNVAI
jgi:hypothetical protein